MDILLLAILLLMMAGVIMVQNLQLKRLKQHEKQLETRPKPVTMGEPAAADLEAKLKASYEAKITESATTFGKDLDNTSKRLGEQVSRLTATVIEEELTAYQKTLEEMRATANEAMEKIRAVVEQQRVEMREGMEAELLVERQHLIEKFDNKLGDVVASYIAESLGGGVDLGAQMQFILTSLEAHKDEIKKDLAGGV